jgi:glycosyltransferase involved in cell wall biosynthesis
MLHINTRSKKTLSADISYASGTRAQDPEPSAASGLPAGPTQAVRARNNIEILYIIAAQQNWGFLEWVCRELRGRGFNLTFLLLHPGEAPLAAFLREAGVPHHQIQVAHRSDLPRAAWQIRGFCTRRRFDLVHTHFMNACLAGLAGGVLAGIPVRIHTRHHSSPHPSSDRKRWEQSFDYLNNRLSTRIIAPCEDVRRRLLEEGVEPDRIELIHHGYDLDAFRDVSEERVQRLRRKYGVPEGGPVIGSISRYIGPKGVQYTVEAFGLLRQKYPDARLVLANAWGSSADTIRARLARLPAGSCVEIPFEADVYALYKLFDVFVHVPVATGVEGFGQTYVEALAAGVPSIFTKAGIAHEFITHRENAWLVDYEDSSQIEAGMATLLENTVLRGRLIRQGRQSVEQRFGLERHVARLEELYCRLTAVGRRRSNGQM